MSNLVSFADFKKFRNLKKADMAKKILSKTATVMKTNDEKVETLITYWSNKDQYYYDLVNSLLESDNQEIFNSTAYQIALRHGEDAMEVFGEDMTVMAESSDIEGISHRIIAVPVCFHKGLLPDTTDIVETLLQTEVFPQYTNTVFLTGWREIGQVSKLSPTAIRHILKDIVAGLEPQDILETKVVTAKENECFVLLGVQSHNQDVIMPQEVDNWNIRFDKEYSALMGWNKAIKEYYPVIRDAMPPTGISGLEETIDIYMDQQTQESESQKYTVVQNFVESTIEQESKRLNTKDHQAVARVSFNSGLNLLMTSKEGRVIGRLKLTTRETPDEEELISFLKTMVEVKIGKPTFEVYDNTQLVTPRG